jgi:hypothetical protein
MLEVLGDMAFMPGDQDWLNPREVLVQRGTADACLLRHFAEPQSRVSPRSASCASRSACIGLTRATSLTRATRNVGSRAASGRRLVHSWGGRGSKSVDDQARHQHVRQRMRQPGSRGAGGRAVRLPIRPQLGARVAL